MLKAQKQQFFAKSKDEPTTVKVGGKFSFSKLPQEVKKKVLNRLAEKDEVMARGLKGELPGLKIDGKQVTRENIHEFELKSEGSIKVKTKVEDITQKSVPRESSEIVEEVIEEENKKYTEKELEKLSFKELKKIGKKFGTTDRSKVNLIKEILNLQK